MFKENADIKKYIGENLKEYLSKSGDSLIDFRDSLQYTKFLGAENSSNELYGWIQYSINDKVFYIITAYSEQNDKKIFHTKEWEEIKKIAKRKKCEYIRMSTKRSPKHFEKIYKLRPVQTIMELEL